MICYKRLIEPSAQDHEQLTRLIRQLSSHPRALTLEDLRRVAVSHYLLIARDDTRNGQIVGTALLAVMRTVSHVNGQIEDVVVDESYRGQSIGRRLIIRLVGHAHEEGVERVDLGSEPHRVAANHLYRTLGFVVRDTNLYRLAL